MAIVETSAAATANVVVSIIRRPVIASPSDGEAKPGGAHLYMNAGSR